MLDILQFMLWPLLACLLLPPILVYLGLLAVTGFFHKDELRRLRQMRRRKIERSPMGSPDSTEQAGEIVATDIGGTGIT